MPAIVVRARKSHGRLRLVSHPSLGLPPLDLTAGFPGAAARILADRERLATRALEAALDAPGDMRQRYDATGLRLRRHDAALLADRVAMCVAADDPTPAHDYGEQTASLYRRDQVPMDDLVALCEGLKVALPSVLDPTELASAVAALDAAAERWRWHRRIAGDARKKNAFLQFLYKGG